MLEVNRAWLERANRGLLESYKEQKPHGPSAEFDGLRILEMSHEDKTNIHKGYISPVYYKKQKEVLDSIEPKEFKGEKRFCVVGGTDGGHLLNAVIKDSLIKNLVVIESDMSSFFHSLTIVDWPALFDDFDRRGGTIFFHIGPVTLDIKNRLGQHLLSIGPYNASNIFISHDNSNVGMDGIRATIQCLQDCINSLGFYDDERVGLAHSIHKMSEGARFLGSHSKPWIDKPAVVCGNGPSLTKILPQIKKHRDKMVLIACGTSIGTMYREGVKPDFFIEQERPLVISNWTKLTTTPEFRDGVTCIGLNVAHPQTHGLFKEAVYVLKANDFGASVVKAYMPDIPQLFFVNPLVANAGASIASSLGFKHIYLAGVDCSFSSSGESHAKGHAYKVEKQDTIEIPGNFSEKVETNQLYNESRKTMEHCIRSNPQISFYNLSDGARFEGATPAKKFRPRHGKDITKEEILRPFVPCESVPDLEEMKRGFVCSMYGLKNTIDSIPEKIKGKDEAYYFIDSIYNYLADLKRKSPKFWHLVKGTITTQLVFLGNCADFSTSHFNEASANLKELASIMHEELKDNPFRFDDFGDNGSMPEDVN